MPVIIIIVNLVHAYITDRFCWLKLLSDAGQLLPSSWHFPDGLHLHLCCIAIAQL